MKQRKLLLGDIHGELEKLERVFSLSGFDFNSDLLIQVGDICDRGASSYEVVELLKTCKHLVLIEGNHDQWLKQYIRSGFSKPDDLWIQQGGMATITSYSGHGLTPAIHKDFYATQVPYYVDDDNNCYVHGGFNRHYPIAEQDMEELAWDRELVQEMMSCGNGQTLQTADGFKHVYIGHTPTIYWGETIPITRGGITNIDTGAGKGGKLTMMNVENGEYWQS